MTNGNEQREEETTREQTADQPEAAEGDPESGAAQQSDTEDSANLELEELSLDQALTRLQAAEESSVNARDDLLRVQAEMQNLRRRTEQDVEKAHKFALERFASELLTVADNLERALAAGSESESEEVKAIHEGVQLTHKSMLEAFRKFSLEPVNPHGEPFDPQLHQAMSIQENGDVEPDTVISVMQKGYTLHGRVLRPAMVIVAKAPA